MEKNKFKYVPSVSNCFMADVKRPGNERGHRRCAMEKVYIGRVWPVWPTYVRVTIGTQDEMNKFKTAFLKVMKAAVNGNSVNRGIDAGQKRRQNSLINRTGSITGSVSGRLRRAARLRP